MAIRKTGENGISCFVRMRSSLFITILILSLFFTSAAFGQVQTRLRVIRASNVGSSVDPSLRDVHEELGSLFSFTSYRLLRDEALHLSRNRPFSISAREGRIIIETTLVGLHRGVAELKIRVVREEKEILNTQVKLSPGRTVLIGGPKLREGVIIYALTAHF
jgi:hypothetical protein